MYVMYVCFCVGYVCMRCVYVCLYVHYVCMYVMYVCYVVNALLCCFMYVRTLRYECVRVCCVSTYV